MQKRYIYFLLSITFLFILSCGSDSDCDKTKKMSLGFELVQTNEGFQLINKTEPECLIKKVEWDFDNDGIFDSEEINPLIKVTQLPVTVTLRVNEIREITQTVGGENNGGEEVAISTSFSVPSSAKVGETIYIKDQSQPVDKVSSRSWSFGDGNSDSSNNSEVEYSYSNPGKYTIELCINFDYCKTEQITITGKSSASTAYNTPAPQNTKPAESMVRNEEPKNNLTEKSTSSYSPPSSPSYSSSERKVENETPKEVDIDGGHLNNIPEEVPPAPTPQSVPVPTPIYSVNFNLPEKIEENKVLTITDASSVQHGNISSYTWTINREEFHGRSVTYTFNETGVIPVILCLNNSNNCKEQAIWVTPKPKTVAKVIAPTPEPTPSVAAKVATPTPQPPPAPLPAVPVPEKSIPSSNASNVSMTDDDFYPTKTGASFGTHKECSTAQWIGETTLILTATQLLQLNKATLYVNDNGRVKIKIVYKNNGKSYEEAVIKNVNRGRSEIRLTDLYATLYPGVTYRLIVSGMNGVQLKNIGSCANASRGDSYLSVDAKGGFVLFNLNYRY